MVLIVISTIGYCLCNKHRNIQNFNDVKVSLIISITMCMHYTCIHIYLYYITGYGCAGASYVAYGLIAREVERLEFIFFCRL